MTIWQFWEPRGSGFAEAVDRGTWISEHGRGECSECGIPDEVRIPPLILEWEPGSDVVGDFVHVGISDWAATDGVLTALADRFRGFEPGPLEMVQDSGLRRPKRVTRRTKPRVWLPYEGPPLHDLWVTAWAHIDCEKSSVRLKRQCTTCGYREYKLEGVEERTFKWDAERLEGHHVRIPRVPGKGLYVHRRDLAGADIFRVHEFASAVLCTDSVKAFIEDHGYTNIIFLEMGELL